MINTVKNYPELDVTDDSWHEHNRDGVREIVGGGIGTLASRLMPFGAKIVIQARSAHVFP